MNRKCKIIILSAMIVLTSLFMFVVYSLSKEDSFISNYLPVFSTINNNIDDGKVDIKITAVGDCTIGSDNNFGYKNSFYEVYDKNNSSYFFSNVVSVFDDDVTLVNLEGTFTDSKIKREKQFNFKAPKEYVDILNKGSIELVNIANNHVYDYNQIGYDDTLNTLNNANINYIGYENFYVYKKNNINIGFAGISCFEDRSCTSLIDKAISALKELETDVMILSFHWGIESSYKQSSVQTYLAHYAIDNGVELVLGHHPHVLQGIELYKDKYIVYSLGNFVFGGNQNPKDKDSMIFQINFTFNNNIIEDTVVNIYPVSISGSKKINDYRPIILTGEEYKRVIKKIEQNSIGITLQ